MAETVIAKISIFVDHKGILFSLIYFIVVTLKLQYKKLYNEI